MKAVGLSVYGIDYAVPRPSLCGIGVIIQRFGDFAVFFSMGPDADDAFAVLVSVFDLPVDPVTVFRFGSNVDGKSGALPNAGSQYFVLDVGFRPGVVGIVGTDRIVADGHTLGFEKTLQLRQPRIIFMNMAYKDISGLLDYCRLLFQRRVYRSMLPENKRIANSLAGYW